MLRRGAIDPAANPLLAQLRARIAERGPITVAEYMAEALGHRTHGYYATRDPLGAAGDFVTAPEISQVFGELVGLWCVQCWVDLGRPAPVLLVELGPGRGTLMADALRAAQVMPAFRDAAAVHLVETSPVLRRRQAETLAQRHPGAPVAWHEAVDDLPDGALLVIANEFFDALPIHQFQNTADGWRERRVGWDAAAGRLRFVLDTRPLGEPPVPPPLSGAPPGALVEVCPAAQATAAALARRIAGRGAAALVIDYGHPVSAPGETLQAVRRHRYADPLVDPGEADLTAHFDFQALGAAARQAGAAVHGPVAQGTWLRRLGVAARVERLAAGAAPAEAAAIRRAASRLTAPDGMGTLFQALALTPPGMAPPAGFAL